MFEDMFLICRQTSRQRTIYYLILKNCIVFIVVIYYLIRPPLVSLPLAELVEILSLLLL